MDKVVKYPNPYIAPGLPRKSLKPRSLVEIFGGENTFNKILEVVSDETNISRKDLTGKCRKREFVMARHLIRYFCTEQLSGHTSMSIVSNWMSNGRISDHSGILNSRNLIRDILTSKSNGEYEEIIRDLVTKIDERLKQITYESNSSYG